MHLLNFIRFSTRRYIPINEWTGVAVLCCHGKRSSYIPTSKVIWSFNGFFLSSIWNCRIINTFNHTQEYCKKWKEERPFSHILARKVVRGWRRSLACPWLNQKLSYRLGIELFQFFQVQCENSPFLPSVREDCKNHQIFFFIMNTYIVCIGYIWIIRISYKDHIHVIGLLSSIIILNNGTFIMIT